VKLLHLHPSCGYGGEIGDRPPEYVVYQDLIHTGRLLMRYVGKTPALPALLCLIMSVKVDYEMVEMCRRRWSFIHPYRLSNRSLPRPERQTDVNSTDVVIAFASESTLNPPSQSETGKSSVEAAKLRFLARKSKQETK
jgi:hypothetical protein